MISCCKWDCDFESLQVFPTTWWSEGYPLFSSWRVILGFKDLKAALKLGGRSLFPKYNNRPPRVIQCVTTKWPQAVRCEAMAASSCTPFRKQPMSIKVSMRASLFLIYLLQHTLKATSPRAGDLIYRTTWSESFRQFTGQKMQFWDNRNYSLIHVEGGK